MFCPCAANWLFVTRACISILRVFLITSMLVSLVFGCSRERKLTLAVLCPLFIIFLCCVSTEIIQMQVEEGYFRVFKEGRRKSQWRHCKMSEIYACF